MSAETKSLAVMPQQPQWNDQRLLDTIKETVCKGATDAQFRMFIEVCKGSGLNPFLKEIWLRNGGRNRKSSGTGQGGASGISRIEGD